MYSVPAARSRRLSVIAIALLALSALLWSLSSLTAQARADGPGSGAPWTASLGDSYISGEAGRWAGNTNMSSSTIDALGSTAYDDNAAGNGELISGCPRSKPAEVSIGGGVSGENLACSGAKTSTFSEGSTFKPGIDFYSSGAKEGQALMLQHFAAAHNVKLVALSIGGNNFNFAGIVQTCVEDWLLSPSWWPNYCNDDSSVTSNFTSSNVSRVKGEITTAIGNVAHAVASASGLPNVKTMELGTAFNGHRLCEKGVGLLEEQGLSSWKGAGASDKTEWINMIRTITAIFPPYEIQEDIHPTYWGELALRNCLTQAYDSGTPKGGTCTISGTGLNGAGEPNMALH